MKRKVLLFLGLVAVLIALLPTYNLCMRTHLRFPELKPWAREVLFNFDDVSAWVSRRVYGYGISIAPNKAIVGQHGRFFLGDHFENTITVSRRSATPEDKAQAEQTAQNLKAWRTWFAQRGVSTFKVMLAPNAASIYREDLPLWAQTQTAPSRTDWMIQHTEAGIWVDPRSRLQQAKAHFKTGLYFLTDTHWNMAGAWVGYQSLAQELGPSHPELQWLTPAMVSEASLEVTSGQDLSKFLRISTVIQDDIPTLRVLRPSPIEITQIDFNTSQTICHGANDPIGLFSANPLLIQSPHALNHKKLLWLRDSFGTLLSPFVAATFSETLQYHWKSGANNPKELEQLTRRFKPDYVLMTVAERDSTVPILRAPPPINH